MNLIKLSKYLKSEPKIKTTFMFDNISSGFYFECNNILISSQTGIQLYHNNEDLKRFRSREVPKNYWFISYDSEIGIQLEGGEFHVFGYIDETDLLVILTMLQNNYTFNNILNFLRSES